MKYMTFNNSCFFASLANILEKGGIDVSDKEIIINSLIPYLFKKDTYSNEYMAGYNIQDDDIITEYLNRYGLCFISKKFNSKKDLIEDLKNKKYVIVALQVLDNSNLHSTVFVRYREPHFIFKNMKRKDSKETDYFMYTSEELLNKLSDKVQFGFIAKVQGSSIANKSVILGDSLVVLNQYKSELIKYVNELHSNKERLESRDILFRALFLNYVDLSKLIDNNSIYSKLSLLQKQYLSSFKNVYDIKISNYLDMDLLEEVFNEITDSILDKIDE